jgi:PKD repeat protein
MCAFSPDGTKFVRLGGDAPAAFRMYDFDRSTGTLSNPATVSMPDATIYAAWACFSPNSRYLYLTNIGEQLYQYDTDAGDVSASVQLIGEYDGFLSVYNLPTGFHTMTLAPDRRIYMSSGNGVNVLHTIHNPDLPGTTCDFRQHDVLLPAHNKFFLPNNPFFRLYNMEGSPCDTLGVKPPAVSFWRSEQDSAAGPLTMNFTDLSYYKPVSWLWDFGDGTGDTTQSPAHVFPAPAIYNVCLTVCNGVGVCNTLCRDVEIVTVGAPAPIQSEVSPIQVYPNPTTGETQWRGLENEEVTLRVYDRLGRLCLQKTTSEGRADLSELPPGLYFWQMVVVEKTVYSGKIEKQ